MRWVYGCYCCTGISSMGWFASETVWVTPWGVARLTGPRDATNGTTYRLFVDRHVCCMHVGQVTAQRAAPEARGTALHCT